eukprot:262178_1
MSAHEMHSTKYRWHQLNVLILQSLLLLTEVISNGINTDTGSWDNWMTGYRVNDKHDGYLDIGDETAFIPQNLKLLYSNHVNCSSSNGISLFANGRIFCTSRNMILSYYPLNGSMSFWYITLGDNYVYNPTFSKYGSYSSVVTYSQSDEFNIYSVDAISGNLIKQDSMKMYYQSQYLVGTQDGNIYLDSSQSSNTNSKPNIFAYNINSYNFSQSTQLSDGKQATPVICNGLVIISGWYGSTYAYTQSPDFRFVWLWDNKYYSGSRENLPVPVCLKNENGLRVIVKPYIIDYCYLLDATNGKYIDTFDCMDLPIFHYNKQTNLVDIAIFNTALYNQIIVVQINGDNIIGKQIWYNYGNIKNGFIVNNYFITAWNTCNVYKQCTLSINIYNIYNGDIEWNTQFNDTSITSETKYSLFGGIVQDEKEDALHLMIMIRIDKTMYAFKEEVNYN